MIVPLPVICLLVAFVVGCMVVAIFCVANCAGLVNAKYSLQDEVRFLKVGNTFQDSKLENIGLKLECFEAAAKSMESQRDVAREECSSWEAIARGAESQFKIANQMQGEACKERDKANHDRDVAQEKSNMDARFNEKLLEERCQACDALEKLQAKLRYLADSVPDGIIGGDA